LDLANRSETTFYWRVRALNYYGNPIGVFSDANTLVNADTVENWQEQSDQVNSFICSQPYFIDLQSSMTDMDGQLPEYYGLDGLHLDLAGKKLMGQIINANWSRVTR
jgi:lysophospholipase L1-like esterase